MGKEKEELVIKDMGVCNSYDITNYEPKIVGKCMTSIVIDRDDYATYNDYLMAASCIVYSQKNELNRLLRKIVNQIPEDIL